MNFLSRPKFRLIIYHKKQMDKFGEVLNYKVICPFLSPEVFAQFIMWLESLSKLGKYENRILLYPELRMILCHQNQMDEFGEFLYYKVVDLILMSEIVIFPIYKIQFQLRVFFPLLCISIQISSSVLIVYNTSFNMAESKPW